MLDDYFAIGRLLANDTVSGILLEAGGLAAGVSALLEVEIPENPHFWHQHSEAATIRGKALEIAESQNLETARLALADLSVAFSKLLRATGIPPSYGSEVQELVCPMWREGQGGSVWLQPAGTVRNPFLGEAMSSCFEGRRTLPVTGSRVLDAVASTTKDAQRHQGHTGNTLALERMDLSPAEQERLDQFVTRYLALEEALVASDLKAARVGVEALREAAKGMEAGPLEGLAAKVVAAAGTEAESLETLRIDFKNLSARVAELVRMAPPSSEVAPVLFRAWCPMAKAEWLQTSSTIANPYYGQAMLTCGSVQEQIPARSSP
jgi:hypothetical protein